LIASDALAVSKKNQQGDHFRVTYYKFPSFYAEIHKLFIDIDFIKICDIDEGTNANGELLKVIKVTYRFVDAHDRSFEVGKGMGCSMFSLYRYLIQTGKKTGGGGGK
jgi:hypothetical protein